MCDFLSWRANAAHAPNQAHPYRVADVFGTRACAECGVCVCFYAVAFVLRYVAELSSSLSISLSLSIYIYIYK